MEEIKYKFINDVPKRKNKPGAGRPKIPPEKRKVGRPQVYTELLGNEICEWLSTGKSLSSYCRKDGNPTYGTIMKWLWKGSKWYRAEFFYNYTEARKQQAQAMSDSIIDIADDATNDFMEELSKEGKIYIKGDAEQIARSRLRVEARKWMASKMWPKVFGEAQTHKVTDGDGNPLIPTNTNLVVNFVKPGAGKNG